MTSFRLIESSVFRDASGSGWPGVAVSLHAADSQAASSGLLHLPASWAESSRGLCVSGKMPHPRNLRPAPTIVRRPAVALPGTIRRQRVMRGSCLGGKAVSEEESPDETGFTRTIQVYHTPSSAENVLGYALAGAEPQPVVAIPLATPVLHHHICRWPVCQCQGRGERIASASFR
jgi:hypothetical protein